ncbi:DUF3089 domain-containing protein [Erythrobacter mangrovi]|uniref:DUF3089 domain-containing protein n=1 Tax=Erythrobacter mangrovi TaxID=2739433 RepID=A0A7D4BEK0_9SPHN|nr:DUF3089 domain-containing protein [Erythrobacter mangrovi]QKG69942.1 DUF3089 domain-containing protein [Erythrobacter mangrovi]
MARKFLYLVAIVIVAFIAGAIALSIWSREATQIAFVPRGEFVEQPPLADNAYQDPAMWYSRPGIGRSDPARYQPAMSRSAGSVAPAEELARESEKAPSFAVFFVPPTSYIKVGGGWNATLDDPTTDGRARLFLQGLASPFNRADEIWAPKYRQAAAGAFLTDKPEAQKAIDAAYADVLQAFRFFVDSVDPDKPIVLAGHSQGAAHILQLLREEIGGTPLQKRIVAVYAPGWPLSVKHDLPALPIPACAAAGQTGCLLAWSTIAEGGDSIMIMERYDATPGFDGQPRGSGPILCVNPLTGGTGGTAPAAANRGTLVPNETLARAELVPDAVPARCGDNGLLYIGEPPVMGEGVLPGDNYHVYDIPLFWKNLQDDVVERVKAWTASRS